MSVASGSSSPKDSPLKRSFSQNIYKAEDDLFSVFSNSVSSVSTPGSGKVQPNLSNGSSKFGAIREGVSLSDTSGNSVGSEDRYAALSSIFAKVETKPNNQDEDSFVGSTFSNGSKSSSPPQSTPISLSKSMSSLAFMGPPMTMSIPRPPSKRSQALPSHFSHQNSVSSNLSRAESYGSLSSSDFRMTTPISISGSSRGPSPLIKGNGDVIPLAVAFQEVISAKFKGSDESRCQVQMFGNVKIAFPSGIVQTLANNPSPAALAFKLTNAAKVEKLHPNKNFVTVLDDTDISSSHLPKEEYSLEIDVTALVVYLRRMREQNPTARYYNIDIVKYQLKSLGVKSCPLQVVTHWKCEPNWTGLKVEYKYNSTALSSLESVKNVTFSVNIHAKVTDIQGKPQPTW